MCFFHTPPYRTHTRRWWFFFLRGGWVFLPNVSGYRKVHSNRGWVVFFALSLPVETCQKPPPSHTHTHTDSTTTTIMYIYYDDDDPNRPPPSCGGGGVAERERAAVAGRGCFGPSRLEWPGKRTRRSTPLLRSSSRRIPAAAAAARVQQSHARQCCALYSTVNAYDAAPCHRRRATPFSARACPRSSRSSRRRRRPRHDRCACARVPSGAYCARVFRDDTRPRRPDNNMHRRKRSATRVDHETQCYWLLRHVNDARHRSTVERTVPEVYSYAAAAAEQPPPMALHRTGHRGPTPPLPICSGGPGTDVRSSSSRRRHVSCLHARVTHKTRGDRAQTTWQHAKTTECARGNVNGRVTWNDGCRAVRGRADPVRVSPRRPLVSRKKNHFPTPPAGHPATVLTRFRVISRRTKRVFSKRAATTPFCTIPECARSVYAQIVTAAGGTRVVTCSHVVQAL